MELHEIVNLNHNSATMAWKDTLHTIIQSGHYVSPRGMITKELLHHHITVDMKVPVVLCDERKLSYRFMAAEAYWICSGNNQLLELARYAPSMIRYSDDGETLAGAYGPRIHDQLEYVLRILKHDPFTRQAVLTIWNPNPPPSKDIPCTVSMVFQLRTINDNAWQLHNHVFMRSSDAWLGLPYDIFSFSMVAIMLCNELNATAQAPLRIEPGNLYLTMASSHLYQDVWMLADQCLLEDDHIQQSIPLALYTHGTDHFLSRLRDMREAGGKELQWWHRELL